MRTDDDLDPRVRRTQRDVVQAASELLLEEGWFALTHAAVASRAGYSKATLYNHWPDPADLGRAAFLHACATPHHEPTGDPRTDLIGERTPHLVRLRQVLGVVDDDELSRRARQGIVEGARLRPRG